MLVSLEIKNFLLIKKISINFTNGFNAFTGETGAGKSIIIEGLKLALGAKNQTNLNLKDGEISSIKAVFEINNSIKKNLEELEMIIDDDYLIVERQINSNQKSKLLINGEIKIGEKKHDNVKDSTLILLTKGEDITVKAKSNAKFLLISGKPINEQIARGGPFVMNTKAEILQAVQDYHNDTFVK